MCLSPYKSVLCNGLQSHTCEGDHPLVLTNFLHMSPLSFRHNMYEAKCIIYLSIKLVTSPHFYKAPPNTPHPHLARVQRHRLIVYPASSMSVVWHALCWAWRMQAYPWKPSGLRARERQMLWWKNLASVDRAQRRECPTCLRSGSRWSLPRMFQVRRFSRRGRKNPNKGESEPTQETRHSQELSGPECLPTGRSASSSASLRPTRMCFWHLSLHLFPQFLIQSFIASLLFWLYYWLFIVKL